MKELKRYFLHTVYVYQYSVVHTIWRWSVKIRKGFANKTHVLHTRHHFNSYNKKNAKTTEEEGDEEEKTAGDSLHQSLFPIC